MTTTDANTQQVQSNLILYEAFRKSVWLNASNRALESYMSRALRVSVIEVGDSSVVQDRTREQLEEAITYTTSDVTETTFTKNYFNGYDSLAMADYRILEAGGKLDSYVSDRLGKKLALHVDDKIAGVVTGSTYDSVDGTGRDNLITVDNRDTIARAFPHATGRADTAQNIASAFKDAHMLLASKDLIDGEYVGDNGPSAFIALGAIPIMRQVVDYLASETQLQDNSNIGMQAEKYRGIFGTAAYRGTYSGIDLGWTNSLGVPADSAPWSVYILPTNSTLFCGFPMMQIDESKFGQGNTQGAYVYRRTAVGEWLAGIGRPEHIIRIDIPSA